MNNTLYPKALYQNFVSIITEYNVYRIHNQRLGLMLCRR